MNRARATGNEIQDDKWLLGNSSSTGNTGIKDCNITCLGGKVIQVLSIGGSNWYWEHIFLAEVSQQQVMKSNIKNSLFLQFFVENYMFSISSEKTATVETVYGYTKHQNSSFNILKSST